MKQFLKMFFQFMIVALGSYFIIVYTVYAFFPKKYAYLLNVIYVPGGNGHLSTRLNDLYNYENVDILIIGSSHAYRGYDPRVFQESGLKMFNLGSSAQSPVQTHYLLKNYVDIIKPSIVVIEVYPKTFNNDGVESSLDLIANCPMKWDLAKMSASLNNVKPFNTFIYRLADQELLGNFYPEELIRGHDTYIPGGFVEREAGVTNEYLIPDFISLELKSYQVDAFERSLDLLKARNIPVILVQSPVTKGIYATFKDKELDKFNSFMRSCGTYYNFNEDESLQDPNLYYDGDHLNQEGVERLNKIFLERFKVSKQFANLKL